MKIILTTILALLSLSFYNRAQVGLNNPNPDPNSILDMSKASDKGLLIPFTNKTQRNALAGAVRDQLVDNRRNHLVYDTQDSLLYLLNTKNFKWYAINTWQLSQNANENLDVVQNNPIYVVPGHRVGIGTDKPSEQLEVAGNIKSSGILSSASVQTNSINTNSVTIQSVTTTSMSTNTITTQSITATNVTGGGIKPTGGIIMWSGTISQIPIGWALCDGKTTRGLTTPNLSERFVVGYDNTDLDYNTAKKVGPTYTDANGTSDGTNSKDAKRIKLTANQSGLRDHMHHMGYTNDNRDNADKNPSLNIKNWFDPGISSLVTSPVTGGLQPAVDFHENRPPFYNLAYIIKL